MHNLPDKSEFTEKVHVNKDNKVNETCQLILNDLKHKDRLKLFVSPMDRFAQFDSIPEPMDLSTIQKKLDMNEIESLEEFARLVRLTFENVITFKIASNSCLNDIVQSTALYLLVQFNWSFSYWGGHYLRVSHQLQTKLKNLSATATSRRLVAASDITRNVMAVEQAESEEEAQTRQQVNVEGKQLQYQQQDVEAGTKEVANKNAPCQKPIKDTNPVKQDTNLRSDEGKTQLPQNKAHKPTNEETIKQEEETDIGQEEYYYFKVIIAGKEAENNINVIRLPRRQDLTFADLRYEIEEDVDNYPHDFKFTFSAKGSVCISLNQEKKWTIWGYGLTKKGDGSYETPYSVFIK